MASDSIAAVTDSLPPATDYLTYLTILEYHLSTNILPTLNNILQDAQLTQNIGWDLIHLLLPLPGAESCLNTIARLGNPREVVLKVTEALQLLDLDSDENDDDAKEELIGVSATEPDDSSSEPTSVDKFCILVHLLSILHPRIKTKYPSRFLSTSLMTILSAYRPSNQATLAVILFVHTVSGKKRPSLPGRKSSLKIPTISPNGTQPPGQSAPDPEAQDEDPQEAVIQSKLLQSFVTHTLEEYVNANTMEWASRLEESFMPDKIVPGRRTLSEAFREDARLQARDTIVGQLVALARDLGLSNYTELFEAIYKTDSHPFEDDGEENYPSSPADIPLAQGGSLFLVASFVFSSIVFGTQIAQPQLSIFPAHAKLVTHFIGNYNPENIESEKHGIVDAVLALGLWLENSNCFVSGPLEDSEFLQYLQSLALLSANNSSPTLRYAAHVLTSSILHAHPVDRVRLTFISDTLENCPYEALKASAVSWLKEEIIIAQERNSETVFASSAALAAVQPYLFPATSSQSEATDEEMIQELRQVFSFHMAVVNFLFFIGGKTYVHIVPPGMMPVVEEIYLGPLRNAQERSLKAIGTVDVSNSLGGDADSVKVELQLLGERIKLCSAQIDHI